MQLAHRGGFLPALIYLEMMSFWWRFGQQLGHTSAGWQQQRQQQLCSPLSPGCCEHPDRLLLLKRRRVPPCRLPARSRMRVRVWFVAFPDKWLPNNIRTSTSMSHWRLTVWASCTRHGCLINRLLTRCVIYRQRHNSTWNYRENIILQWINPAKLQQPRVVAI